MGVIARFAVLLTLVFAAGTARAEGPLSAQLPKKTNLAKLIGEHSGKALVKDALLYGSVSAKTTLLKSGGLRLVKKKVYDRVQHPETGKIYKLKDKWTVDYKWEVNSRLRIVSGIVRKKMYRSIEKTLGGFPFFEEYSKYLDWDEWRTTSNKNQTVLSTQKVLGGKVTDSESFEYEPNAVPIPVLELALAAAARHGLTSFDLDVLLPDGSAHGLDVTARSSKNLASVNGEYPFPASVRKMLKLDHPATVFEIRLSSPVKRLFYPHRFYLAYAKSSRNFLGFWGGKPGVVEYRYAFNSALKP